MAHTWRRLGGRMLRNAGRTLVRLEPRWLRYGWLQRILLRLERWCEPACLPPTAAHQQALLEAAYCIRGVLARYAGLEEVSVGLEADRVVVLLRHELPPAMQGQLRALVDGAVEIRAAAELPLCQSLDGDHCNSDYDRS